MLLLISLFLVGGFLFLLRDALKQHAIWFYIGGALLTIGIFSLRFVTLPPFLANWIVALFSKGAIGTAAFVYVMYAGALPKGNRLIAPIMKVRGELSILAAILVLSHNFTYGMTYFVLLFTQPQKLSATHMAASLVSIVLISIMVVLTVMSFPAVRKKMHAKTWKRWQRLAYIFYALIYVHVLLIHIPLARMGIPTYKINVIVYSLVFLTYAVMRLVKFTTEKKRCAVGKMAGTFGTIFACVFVFVLYLTFSAPQAKSVVAKEDAELAKMMQEIENETAKTESTSKASANHADNRSQTENSQKTDVAAGTSEAQMIQTEEQSLQADNAEKTTLESSLVQGEEAAEEKQEEKSEKEEVRAVAEEAQTEQQTQPATEARTFKEDGTYTGSAVCDTYDYTVTVTITIAGDAVAGVSAAAEAAGEDTTYFRMADAQVTSAIQANGGIEGVDAVSGATKSSMAIKKAYLYAYRAAKK